MFVKGATIVVEVSESIGKQLRRMIYDLSKYYAILCMYACIIPDIIVPACCNRKYKYYVYGKC